jgi:hypothetical protein
MVRARSCSRESRKARPLPYWLRCGHASNRAPLHGVSSTLDSESRSHLKYLGVTILTARSRPLPPDSFLKVG